MNKDKREPDYPAELESQFILRLPEEPAKALRELLRSGDNIKNRLTIQIDNDMRHGEVRFDHWLMHAKIIDLPTIVESLKTIDNKSFYKTADICQMMICKEEPDQTPSEEETQSKNKKKDPFKVDKKFLWPHGLTPPTKNVRKRRFRKTLKKKYVEAPEIEKEVKRLLRADNEAIHLTWEVIKEEDELLSKSELAAPTAPMKADKKKKADRAAKKETKAANASKGKSSSNIVDIFGGAVSDSDAEEEPTPGRSDNSKKSDGHLKKGKNPVEIDPKILPTKKAGRGGKKSPKKRCPSTVTSTMTRSAQSSEEDGDNLSRDTSKDNMSLRIEQLRKELEEVKLRRQRTKNEIEGMENAALRQRFQDILHTLNQDVMYKEMEYQGLITLQNSEDI